MSRAQRPPVPIDDLFGTPADSGAVPAAPTDTAAISSAKPRTKPVKRAPRPREVLPAQPAAELAAHLAQLALALPAPIHLGTSSWSFPGWDGLVYGGSYTSTILSREGLAAYAAHPLLRAVSLDRSFYAPLSAAGYAAYAAQTPADFRFVVKAPSLITDVVVRGERGQANGDNPCFLDSDLAVRDFVAPCIEGLGQRAGALVFQFPPLPPAWLAEPGAWIDRVGTFLAALPPLPAGVWYAVEIRDGALLTPRLIKMLHAAKARYCVAVHHRMPDVVRQASALAMLDTLAPGPLLVRWSLHAGFKYEQAKAKYEPFNQLVDEDLPTRAALAQLAAHYALAGQPVMITANNKAEGSAPLTCLKLAEAIVAALQEAAQPPR